MFSRLRRRPTFRIPREARRTKRHRDRDYPSSLPRKGGTFTGNESRFRESNDRNDRTLAIAGASRGKRGFRTVVHRAYATLLTNGGRNVSNRFVTKIEDDFSSSPLSTGLLPSPPSLSFSLSPLPTDLFSCITVVVRSPCGVVTTRLVPIW